ncbi:hypothetical protein TSAR_014870 [Trichomalopsis sarcophagae]|uniref:Uncharacterized protein n=1 Tax=Trichomalopsis sarcophagae TaxID=543379 RepID=A0A232EDL9_9HYME|nr:hypothetical protein TSAR_014870 [Trichomalopsis sarcophagae]
MLRENVITRPQHINLVRYRRSSAPSFSTWYHYSQLNIVLRNSAHMHFQQRNHLQILNFCFALLCPLLI